MGQPAISDFIRKEASPNVRLLASLDVNDFLSIVYHSQMAIWIMQPTRSEGPLSRFPFNFRQMQIHINKYIFIFLN